MRARYKREKQKTLSGNPESQGDVEKIASNISYSGSPEHKSYPLRGAAPRLRSDATKCPPIYKDREAELTEVLRKAFLRGAFSAASEEGFPRYIWLRLDGVLYEARHIRGPSGAYKAYALEDASEHPDDPGGCIGSYAVVS